MLFRTVRSFRGRMLVCCFAVRNGILWWISAVLRRWLWNSVLSLTWSDFAAHERRLVVQKVWMDDNICMHSHFVSCKFLGTFKLASAGPLCKVQQRNVIVVVVDVCAMGFQLAGEWIECCDDILIRWFANVEWKHCETPRLKECWLCMDAIWRLPF